MYTLFSYVASLLFMVHNLKFLVTLDNTSNFIRGTFSFNKILFFLHTKIFYDKVFQNCFRNAFHYHVIVQYVCFWLDTSSLSLKDQVPYTVRSSEQITEGHGNDNYFFKITEIFQNYYQ